MLPKVRKEITDHYSTVSECGIKEMCPRSAKEDNKESFEDPTMPSGNRNTWHKRSILFGDYEDKGVIFIATTENNHGRNVNWFYEKTDV